ncbi:InlB B-repeat-containing protein [Sporolactobacillus shoreae]|nr:InlB B-repeat-containing protein [Sporolactobacillus shoreae]
MHSKKYSFIFLAFIMLLSPIVQLFTYPQVGLAAASSFAGGNGTAEDPWMIATPQQLDNVRNDLSAHYQLVNDIDLSSYVSSSGAGYHGGAGWEPIGNESTTFTGTFDGQGHKIIGLQINRPSSNFIGLFGDVGLGGKVEDIGIEGGSVSGNMHIGGLAGSNDGGSIVNSYSSCIVYGDRGTGGLVGRNLGNITNTYATGNVNGRDGAGGLVGYGYGGGINNTYATGRVNGTSSVGGLVGINAGSTILNSFYNTETTGQSDTGRGTPKTTAEMKTSSTYTDAGWDFDNTWGINSAVNGGYPFFVSHYLVTYNDNGSTAGSVPTDNNAYKEQDTVTVQNNTGNLGKDGYTFDGWNTKPDGSGTTYAPGAQLTMGTSDVTLYAKWTKNFYLITYNGNGSNEDDITYTTPLSEPGTQFDVVANQFTRSGYSFTGWNTKADGSGTTYQPGDKYTLGTFNVTMYAQWAPIAQYHVAYDGNGNDGGFVPPQSVLTASGDTVTVQGNLGELSRSGYTFEGWNTESDGSGTTYHANDLLTISESSVTLYAQWEINSYSVSFERNGGSAADDQTVNYGDKVSEPSEPARTGYTFDGWYADSGLTKAFDFSTVITTNRTLYAKWNPNHYTVRFDSNAGSAVTAIDADYGAIISVPSVPTKEGYTFTGWYTDKNLTETWDFNKDTVAGDTTLYAKWTASRYSIMYDGNGNDGGSVPSNESDQYKSAVTLARNTGNLSKIGYTFTGWNTESNGSGTAYAPGDSFTLGSANVQLYAQWTINPYTVSFDSNGGSAISDQKLNYGDSAVKPADPSQTGYTFAGWYADNGLTKVFDFGTKITADTTLYAKWTANPYTVHFESNGGSTQQVDHARTNLTQERTGLTAQTVDKKRLQAKSDILPTTGDGSDFFAMLSGLALFIFAGLITFITRRLKKNN